MAEGTTYPKIPESNWWAIRTQFRKSLPPIVSGSYLKSLLSLTSDRAATNLLPPLKQIGLIDDEGRPTDRANEWRDDAKYHSVCQAILREVYPPELLSLFAGPEFDRDKIAQWFMTTAKLGDGTAKAAASMYILLNCEEIKADTSTNGNSPTKKTTKKTTVRKAETSSAELPSRQSVSIDLSNSPNMSNSERLSSPTLHIDLQIHISPDASSEQIDSIFASIAKHLYSRS